MKRITIVNCIRLLTAALMLKCGSVATAILGAPGDIIYAHVGTNNPTSEGFTAAIGAGITTPAPNPAGTAWRLVDDNPESDQRAFYLYGSGPLDSGELTPAEITKLQTRGWMMEWTLDVISSSGLTTRDVYFSFTLNNGNGDRRYNIHHHDDGTNLQLDVNPNFSALPDFVIPGTNFHSIAVVNYGNNTDAVELFVDGISLATFSPDVDSANAFFGGSITSLGGADWSLVRFSVVPEPASAILCLGGSLLLLRRRK